MPKYKDGDLCPSCGDRRTWEGCGIDGCGIVTRCLCNDSDCGHDSTGRCTENVELGGSKNYCSMCYINALGNYRDA